jgi:hypothetical protein
MLEVLTQNDVFIDPSLLVMPEEEGQVVIHFLYEEVYDSFMGIRIWPTTYLYDQSSSHRSTLIHVENITLAPEWTSIFPGSKKSFTLIFSGLPKSCTIFDFVEECNSEGPPFELRSIKRNNTDVYFLKIS